MFNIMKLYETTPYLTDGADENEPTVDFYTLPQEKRQSDALMLIFPGGGYTCLAEHEGKGYAEYFNSIGISAAVLYYRCLPYSHPCQLLDARRAVRVAKQKAAEYGYLPEKIVLVGSSAGGHLAAMTAMHHSVDCIDEAERSDELFGISQKVAGMVLCYPVISMIKYQTQFCVDNLLGDRDELLEKLSVERSAGNDMPPAFIWSTFDDNVVDVRNSIMLANRYKELELDCELHIFAHGQHGMGLADCNKSVGQWATLCKMWLITHGFLNDAEKGD